MKAWWLGLQANERRTLSVGGAALLVILLYFGAWAPLRDDAAQMEKQVQELQALKRWMEQASQQANRLQSRASTQNKRSGRSWLSVVDQAAKRGRLGGNLKRLEPDGKAGVKVWLEQVSFDDMARWLVGLEQQYRLAVATITIDRQTESGRVNARMTLRGPE